MAVAKHVAENEKLLEEIAQLRTRLVAKAETIGAMQFSNVSILSSNPPNGSMDRHGGVRK